MHLPNFAGTQRAVSNVIEVIGPAVKGFDPRDQTRLDELLLELDGTRNKSNLGANAMLGVSLAVAKAGAASKRVPLFAHVAELAGKESFVMPVPMANVINGGEHAGNALPFQEFMIAPLDAETFREALRMVAETYHHLKAEIKAK